MVLTFALISIKCIFWSMSIPFVVIKWKWGKTVFPCFNNKNNITSNKKNYQHVLFWLTNNGKSEIICWWKKNFGTDFHIPKSIVGHWFCVEVVLKENTIFLYTHLCMICYILIILPFWLDFSIVWWCFIH